MTVRQAVIDIRLPAGAVAAAAVLGGLLAIATGSQDAGTAAAASSATPTAERPATGLQRRIVPMIVATATVTVTPAPAPTITIRTTVTATATRTVVVEKQLRDRAKPAPASRYYRNRVSTSGSTVWDRLAECESGGDWHANTGNGFYGGVQFTRQSWKAVGGTGLPSNASREEQILRAEKLKAIQGWGAWPVCSIKIGVR